MSSQTHWFTENIERERDRIQNMSIDELLKEASNVLFNPLQINFTNVKVLTRTLEEIALPSDVDAFTAEDMEGYLNETLRRGKT